MAQLIDRTRRYAAQHALWAPGVRVAAAVSGGSDSVALLFLLVDLARRGDLVLAGLVHLHHHIRGAAADGDAAFCRELAVRCGVPALVGDADVPALAARERTSIEVAGRQARQAFFREAAATLGAQVVALAHTLDDQAETLLLRLVRGAGTAGLGGIAPRRGAIVRPLLGASRAELRGYLGSIGETWRDDETNRLCDNPRNRMRHEVIPALRAFNPRVDAALARAADILRSDADCLDRLAAAAARGLMRVTEEAVVLDAVELAGLHLAVARRVALLALETAGPGRSYGLEEADAVCRLAERPAPRSGASGVRMERSGAFVVLTVERPLDPGEATGGAEPAELALDVPGRVHDARGGWVLAAEGPFARASDGADWTHAAAGPGAGDRVVVDAARLGTRLRVRRRRPGDRLRPLGAPGRRKLQDVLVDRKVPRDERDLVPVVTDAAGDIVWVAGHVLAHGYRLSPETREVVVLSVRRA